MIENPACPIIIAGSPEWHKGLVGLAASRVTDRFQRPCLIFSQDEIRRSNGSARSIAGVDIGAAVRGAVEAGVAKKGGGHTMAAGVTIEQPRIREFATYMREAVGPSYRAAAASPMLPVDGALTPRSATIEFAKQLENAGPFGQGNPAPRFCMPSVRFTMVKEFSGGHLRCALQSIDGARSAPSLSGPQLGNRRRTRARTRPWLPCRGADRRDEWGGRNRVEFQIEDVAGPPNAKQHWVCKLQLAKQCKRELYRLGLRCR